MKSQIYMLKLKNQVQKSDKAVALEVKINTDNTRITTRLDNLKREISNVETTSVNAIQIINAANTTSIKELDKKITESKNEITKLETLLVDKNNKIKIDKEIQKMNELITRVPFQLRVLSIIATDHVEILGNTEQVFWYC